MDDPSPDLTVLRVLCLEDSLVDADLVRRTLTAAGHDLTMDLATGRAEFEALLGGGYDVILGLLPAALVTLMGCTGAPVRALRRIGWTRVPYPNRDYEPLVSALPDLSERA